MHGAPAAALPVLPVDLFLEMTRNKCSYSYLIGLASACLGDSTSTVFFCKRTAHVRRKTRGVRGSVRMVLKLGCQGSDGAALSTGV